MNKKFKQRLLLIIITIILLIIKKSLIKKGLKNFTKHFKPFRSFVINAWIGVKIEKSGK